MSRLITHTALTSSRRGLAPASLSIGCAGRRRPSVLHSVISLAAIIEAQDGAQNNENLTRVYGQHGGLNARHA